MIILILHSHLQFLSQDQLIESAYVVCWSFDYVELERAVNPKGFESSGGSAYKAAHISVLAMLLLCVTSTVQH